MGLKLLSFVTIIFTRNILAHIVGISKLGFVATKRSLVFRRSYSVCHSSICIGGNILNG